MGNKTLIRLLGALVAVGVLALIVHFTGAGKLERGKRENDIDRKLVIEDMKAAEISKVRVNSVGNELTFVRNEGGWELVERNNYPADGSTIDRLLLTASRLKIRQQPSLSASSLGSVELLDPVREGASEEDSATVLNFIGEDGKEKGAVWLGKIYEVENGRPGMFGSSGQDVGRFVRSGDSETVFLVEETFSDIKTDASEWLDDSFFSVSQVKSVARDSGKPEEDWTLVRDDANGDFSFAKPKAGEELDIGKVSSMKNAFASPRFEDVVSNDPAKDGPDAVTFTVETFDNFVYTVKVSEKDAAGELILTVDATATFEEKRKEGPEESDDEKKRLDDAFAAELKAQKDKLADVKKLSGWVYRTRSYFVDSINKKRSEILKEADDAEAGSSAAPGAGAGAALPGGINLPGLPGGHPPIPPASTLKPESKSKDDAKPADAPKKAVEEAPKANAKPEPKPKADAAAKPEAKPADKPAPKPATATKPETKPADKPAPKPADKPAPKPEAKPAGDAKPE